MFLKKRMELIALLNIALLIVALAIILFIIAYNWFCKSKYTKKYSTFPTYGANNQLLVLWQHYQKIRNLKQIPPLSYLLKLTTAYAYVFQREGIFQQWFGFTPYVGIYKAEYVKAVINSRVADDKSMDYFALHPVFKSGLATSAGKIWRKRRKLLQPTFHLRILEEYIPIFNEHSLELVNKLKRTINEPWIDVMPILTPCTMDILCHTLMGFRINAQAGSQEALEYIESFEEFTDCSMHRMLRPWLWHDLIFYNSSVGRKSKRIENYIHGFARKVIQEKKKYFNLDKDGIENCEHSKGESKSFLELLLAQHAIDPSITLKEIQEEVTTFIYAGHDTAAVALSCTLYLLGLYPDIQNNVLQELHSIFGDDKKREVTNDDVKNMVYLEKVIKESLRLYPPGPIIARENKENINIGKHTIPTGSHILIIIYMLHRDPDVFPNPEKFDPERFSSENISKTEAFSYIPFSTGPRSCIGQRFAMLEMKVMLSHILRNFEITSLDPRDKLNVMMKVTLRCLSPIRLRFTKRL